MFAIAFALNATAARAQSLPSPSPTPSQRQSLDEAWWKIRHARQLRSKSRSVAQTVAAWRERKARERDIPARFVLADLPLMAIREVASFGLRLG